MIAIDAVRQVELELSSYCNASCPLCPRNLFGYPYNSGYNVKHLTLDNIKKIFSREFLMQLKIITFEGNFGDFSMNPQTPDIVDWLLEQNSNLIIEAHTNGSTNNKTYWQRLHNVDIFFCLDGLEDTHNIYRRNTNFKKILKNAQAHIKAGGNAYWKMIKFDHNKHQIDECKQLATELGFKGFSLIDHGRDNGPVFDNNGNHLYNIGPWTGETDIVKILDIIANSDILLEDICETEKPELNCMSKIKSEIYIDCNGLVYPCCYMGFKPDSYGHGRWHQPINKQLKNIVKNNNALEFGLENAIQWFAEIEKCWNIDKFDNGRLLVCDSNCGKCK